MGPVDGFAKRPEFSADISTVYGGEEGIRTLDTALDGITV